MDSLFCAEHASIQLDGAQKFTENLTVVCRCSLSSLVPTSLLLAQVYCCCCCQSSAYLQEEDSDSDLEDLHHVIQQSVEQLHVTDSSLKKRRSDPMGTGISLDPSKYVCCSADKPFHHSQNKVVMFDLLPKMCDSFQA